MQDVLGTPAETSMAAGRFAERDRAEHRAADPDALARLLPEHQQPLYALCRGTLDNAQDAEDAVQETMLRALRALSAFRGDCSLRTWLCRIAVNVCLDWRKASRRASALHQAVGRAAPEPPPAQAVALDHLRVLEALRRLPPARRAVLLLRELEGWTVAEIADAMACKPKRIENDLYHARRAMAEWARQETEDGG